MSKDYLTNGGSPIAFQMFFKEHEHKENFDEAFWLAILLTLGRNIPTDSCEFRGALADHYDTFAIIRELNRWFRQHRSLGNRMLPAPKEHYVGVSRILSSAYTEPELIQLYFRRSFKEASTGISNPGLFFVQKPPNLADWLEYSVPLPDGDNNDRANTLPLSALQELHWRQVLKEELSSFNFGKMVFNPPNSMSTGEKYRIECRIAQSLKTNIASKLKGQGVPQTEIIRVSELMSVKLDGENFEIFEHSSQEQILSDNGYTEWSWDVRPLKSGLQKMTLHISIRIRLPYGEERKDHPVLNYEVDVKVNAPYQIRTFFSNNWKWVAGSALLPLIGWIGKLIFDAPVGK